MSDNPNPLPPSTCPTCGYVMDAATCAHDETARPSEGDLSVCLGCGEFMVFGPGLQLRELDLNTMLTLPNETVDNLVRHQNIIRQKRFPVTRK